MDDATKDAAVAVLRQARPAVAAIEDKHARAKVTDALLSAVRGKDMMGEIARAAQDSAKAAAEKTSKNTYETMCAGPRPAMRPGTPTRRRRRTNHGTESPGDRHQYAPRFCGVLCETT